MISIKAYSFFRNNIFISLIWTSYADHILFFKAHHWAHLFNKMYFFTILNIRVSKWVPKQFIILRNINSWFFTISFHIPKNNWITFTIKTNYYSHNWWSCSYSNVNNLSFYFISGIWNAKTNWYIFKISNVESLNSLFIPYYTVVFIHGKIFRYSICNMISVLIFWKFLL